MTVLFAIAGIAGLSVLVIEGTRVACDPNCSVRRLLRDVL